MRQLVVLRTKELLAQRFTRFPNRNQEEIFASDSNKPSAVANIDSLIRLNLDILGTKVKKAFLDSIKKQDRNILIQHLQ